LSAGGERSEAAALDRAAADALGRAAGAPGAPAGVWGLLADFHAATGSPPSQREALLKQARGPGYARLLDALACSSFLKVHTRKHRCQQSMKALEPA